tara:strand:+ start:572 stop:901 length:330 start_codon:yes stop_codon:yes gene_type:complete
MDCKTTFKQLKDIKQLAKRRVGAEKMPRTYAVFKCNKCKQKISILKSNLSKMRLCAFYDHLTSCPKMDEADRVKYSRKHRGKKPCGGVPIEEETSAAMRKIDSYAYKPT